MLIKRVIIFLLFLGNISLYCLPLDLSSKVKILPNGMSLITLTKSGLSPEIKLWFRTGVFYENDSFPGLNILAGKLVHLKSLKNEKLLNANLSFNIDREHVVFSFKPGTDNQETLINEFINILSDTLFSEALIKQGFDWVQEEEKRLLGESAYVVEQNKLQKLYKAQYYKVNPFGKKSERNLITSDVLRSYIFRYYSPNNCVGTASGSVTDLSQSETLISWRKYLFNYESIVRFIDIKQIIHSSQTVLFENKNQAELEFNFLFPGIAGLENKGFEMLLFSRMFPDIMGSKYKLQSSVDLNVRSTVFTVKIPVVKGKLRETYYSFLNDIKRIDLKLTSAEVNSSRENLLKWLDELPIEQPVLFNTLVAKTTYSSNSSFMNQVKDSLVNVGLQRMKIFVSEYLNNRDFVSFLRVSDSEYKQFGYDSIYRNIDESVFKIEMPYGKNQYFLVDSQHHNFLNSVFQWAVINPEFTVQVNGFSDDSEYFKAYDNSMLEFMDTIPTFKRIMPEYFKKGYLRIEMLRAMNVLRYLYLKGIDPQRLVGTSMCLKKYKEKASENMKCTVSFPVARNRFVDYSKIK